MIRRLLFTSAALLLAAQVFAAQARAGDTAVTEASVRATAPGQDSAAVSLRIRSAKAARLVAVSSPAAEKVEIHVMQHENGMMMMRQVDALELPANQDVVLGAGSHLMLEGLVHPLKAGDTVRLNLTLEYAGKHKETFTVNAEVRPLTAGHEMHDMEGHRH